LELDLKMQACEDPKKPIAILGGGITGLYCAYVLRANGYENITLYEASERLGGRIRTVRLDRNCQELTKDTWNPPAKAPADNPMQFYVEFGPMRVELDKQSLLKGLLDELQIVPQRDNKDTGPYLKEFPSYSSPTSKDDPQYVLRPEEVDKTPMELLKLALMRIAVEVEIQPARTLREQLPANWQASYPVRQLIERLTLTAALQRPTLEVFDEWVKGLTESHLWEVQTLGKIGGVSLYSMGFWNLLSDYLSHGAILKLRDLGTFYHLLPENPNAAEWFVWWLRGLSIGNDLVGIHGGMECIIDRLVDRLIAGGFKKDAPESPENGTLSLLTKKPIQAIESTATGTYRLKLEVKDNSPAELPTDYHRVIIALPKRATERLVAQSGNAFVQPTMSQLLDCAFGFPMVKTFVVVKRRWWQRNRTNRYATRVPTRELHYWKAISPDNDQGLIMAYTDSPAATFWANYVKPGAQTDANWGRPGKHDAQALPRDLELRLLKKTIRYFTANDVPELSSQDIAWYGIRDWGRPPYQGANHAWRPERRYWVVMRRLADLESNPGSEGHAQRFQTIMVSLKVRCVRRHMSCIESWIACRTTRSPNYRGLVALRGHPRSRRCYLRFSQPLPRYRSRFPPRRSRI